MKIEHEINLENLHKTIEESLNFNDNEMLFGQLSSITTAKNEIKDLLDKVEKIELEAKGLINSKAKALYGNDWQVISGKGYKILRSPTGAVFTRNPAIKVDKKFIKIVESINTDAVKAELDKTEKLPTGIELNPDRGETIKITIK